MQALDEDVANAKVAAGQLKKERKQLEDQIKSQLDEALEMYIAALEEIQKKQQDIDKLSKDLAEIKVKNDELLKKCNHSNIIAFYFYLKCTYNKLTWLLAPS